MTAPGAHQRPEVRDRAVGALVGLAVGDAVGTTLEFKDRDTYQPLTEHSEALELFGFRDGISQPVALAGARPTALFGPCSPLTRTSMHSL